MEDVINFIKSQKISYLATVENKTQARVRPMNGLVEINNKLVWCTNNQKDMFKQVVECPNVEVCMFANGKTVRVTGKCVATKEDSFRKQYLEMMPGVAKLYGGKEDTLEILVFETAIATVVDVNGKNTYELY